MDAPAPADIEALFDYYFEHGCPCRFPRFRAAVARDLKEIGAQDWGVSDVGMLLTVFDRRVRIVDETREGLATKGRCQLCGAAILRFGIPVFRDSFLERAHITPAALPNTGAEETWPLPICGRVFQAGPGNPTREEKKRIERAYPRLGASDWLTYMRALASQ